MVGGLHLQAGVRWLVLHAGGGLEELGLLEEARHGRLLWRPQTITAGIFGPTERLALARRLTELLQKVLVSLLIRRCWRLPMVWLGSGSDARHTGRISFVAWMVVCAAILVNKLVVLALHRGEEALVDHVAVGAKLASRLRLAGQVLGGLVPGPIRLNGVLLSVLLAYRLL